MGQSPMLTLVRPARSAMARRCVRATSVPASTGRPRRRRSPESPGRRQVHGDALLTIFLLPPSGFSTCGPPASAAAHTSSGDATGKICRRGDRDRPRRWTAVAQGGAAATGTARLGHGGGERSDHRLCRQTIGLIAGVVRGIVRARNAGDPATGHADRASDRAHHLGRTARPADGQLGSGRRPPRRGSGDSREQGPQRLGAVGGRPVSRNRLLGACGGSALR